MEIDYSNGNGWWFNDGYKNFGGKYGESHGNYQWPWVMAMMPLWMIIWYLYWIMAMIDYQPWLWIIHPGNGWWFNDGYKGIWAKYVLDVLCFSWGSFLRTTQDWIYRLQDAYDRGHSPRSIYHLAKMYSGIFLNQVMPFTSHQDIQIRHGYPNLKIDFPLASW